MATMPRIPGRGSYARSASRPRPAWDRSETRVAVPQRRPGKPIAGLAGRHLGACAVLFNGASLAQHDLHAIRVPIIGMNRTFVGFPKYEGPQPHYYCYVDVAWFATARQLDREGVVTVINGSTDMSAIGYRATRCERMRPFSFDLARDGYVDPIPCTTGHLALQVAAYLGCTRIYALGLDMGGPHFDGTRSSRAIPDADAYHRRQAPLLAARGIDVWLCGSPASRSRAFPHAPFEALLAEEA